MIEKHGRWSFALDSDTVDLWADTDRYTLYQAIKRNFTYSLAKDPRKAREKFYLILRGGTASPKAVRQVDLALSGRTPSSETSRRIPTAVIRKIQQVSNGARRSTVHAHFETSIDYYQERDPTVYPDMKPVLVPVYRKMNQDRFIDAVTRGRPGTVTAAEHRNIVQWAEDIKPVQWPTLPPTEELKRCAKCIGMSRQSWRGRWFGGAEDDLYRALFWQGKPLKAYAGTAANLIHPTPRELMKTCRLFPGRLAVIAVILFNHLIKFDGEYREGGMWNLNRLLPLDPRRWLNVQHSWVPATAGKGIPWIRDLLETDYRHVRSTWTRQDRYPAVYNCDPVELWPVLEQSAWFWCAFIDVINGRGWGDSQAARYIRGEIG